MSRLERKPRIPEVSGKVLHFPTDPPAPSHAAPTPKIQEFHPKIREFHPKIREFHPKIREFHPKIRESPPETREFHPKIREFHPKTRASRRSVVFLGILLLLSWLVWGILHFLTWKKVGKPLGELELRNLSWNLHSAQQELQQLQAEVEHHQLKLQGFTELLCRTTEDSRKCPSGWKFFRNGCYSFSRNPKTWQGASEACGRFGAHLAVLSVEEEQVFLMENRPGNDSYWIGVVIKHRDGGWAWVTGENPNFGFWDVWDEEPEKEGKDCGAMRPNGRWGIRSCAEIHPWICEKEWDC